MLKKKLLLVLAVLLPSYSYSDSITPYYGQSGNAAAGGLSWSMGSVLPGTPGLDVNTVIYNYTINKDVDDHVDVYVQNKNASGTGYIFREHDEWQPGSLGGTQINKVVPVIPNIPLSYWGDGEIEVDGPGSVSDPTVVYNYRVDPCFDPQYDPNCPGYVVPTPTIVEVDLSTIYDATKDENIDLDREVDTDLIKSEDEEEKSEEELAKEEEEEEEEREIRLEDALAEAGRSLMFANALAQSQMLASVNAATNLNSYYSATIPGGTYNESVVLVDKEMPENKRGLRNGLAQQLLHEKMVDMQY